MNREIKVQFIIDGKHLSDCFTLWEIVQGTVSEEMIIEDMEVCTCQLSEGNPTCEGDCIRFENSSITGYRTFTGLLDKNGKEIYEGDIVKYFSVERSVQQSHADINPEIDTCVICTKKEVVVFKEGAFRVNDLSFDYIGYSEYDIDSIKEACGCVDDESCDIDGHEIDESILGIEIIGNIYESPLTT